MKLTIFTPTYNRASYLPVLYQSLCRQTVSDFEWLIVDDGSTDDTRKVVEGFIGEGIIPIRYVEQENGGKHTAINRALTMALGDYFFIVDSDDSLTDNAIAVIFKHLFHIEDDKYCGLIFNRVFPDGTINGETHNQNNLSCSLYDLKYKYHQNFDKAEIFKTAILKQYPFPVIRQESFCNEALIMYRMSGPFLIYYVNENVYIGNYLDGGLTKNNVRNRRKSSNYSCLYYKEQFERADSFILKIKSGINYFRFKNKETNIHCSFGLLQPVVFLLGKIFRSKDSFSLRKVRD